MNRWTCRWLAMTCCLFCLGSLPVFAAVQYSAKDRRDPFTDPAASHPPKADPEQAGSVLKTLKLQGILYNAGNPRAIINSKIVAIGDTIAGKAKVTSINKEGVELTLSNGKPYFLKETLRKKSDDTTPKKAPLKKN